MMISKYDNSSEPISWILNDAAVSYAQSNSKLRLAHKSRIGILRQELMQFAGHIKRPIVELADILPSSYSTLTKKDRFDRATSEHILQLRDLYLFGIEVFGDIGVFNSWLDEPLELYDGASSFMMLDTHYGIQLVTEALIKIDRGLPV